MKKLLLILVGLFGPTEGNYAIYSILLVGGKITLSTKLQDILDTGLTFIILFAITLIFNILFLKFYYSLNKDIFKIELMRKYAGINKVNKTKVFPKKTRKIGLSLRVMLWLYKKGEKWLKSFFILIEPVSYVAYIQKIKKISKAIFPLSYSSVISSIVLTTLGYILQTIIRAIF